MEVKIGMQQVPRELVLEIDQTPDEVEKAVSKAVSAGEVLQLTDDKGRRVVVVSSKIAYVEIAAERHRPVGFTPS